MRLIKFLILLTPFMWLTSCKPVGTDVIISGELRQWHKVTLTADGPYATEMDTVINPFLDYKMSVIFSRERDSEPIEVPGYFAADGNAAETSSGSGNKWRAHFTPTDTGIWNYKVRMVRGRNSAITVDENSEFEIIIDESGSFVVAPSDKNGRDFRAKGTLSYTGKRYLQFSGTGEYFLKAGTDSPENLLAYSDFDGTYSAKEVGTIRSGEAATTNLKSWGPHLRDWNEGDPSWQNGKGKGLIGALNYLSSKGCNSVSFLTYNAGGDGDDVWPFTSRDDKMHFDCSKLDQWQIVFDQAQELGLYLHFKLQETEIDDNFLNDSTRVIAESLDGGDLGIERKLYLRELIARYGYEPALNWNLGEENTQTPEQQSAMAAYIDELDPYGHNIVIHTYPDWQERVYSKLTGNQSLLTGASLQNSWNSAHQRTLQWIRESEKAGRPWVVANDEQGPHFTGVPPDPGYEGHDGIARPANSKTTYDLNDIRKNTLWGVLMAGGAGVEYYFGYTLPQTDLGCQDLRSRDKSWEYCNIALNFFSDNNIPFWDMNDADSLAGNYKNDNSSYCFAKDGELYLIYLPEGGNAKLDLRSITSTFEVKWFDPRNGGSLLDGQIRQVKGPGIVNAGEPPSGKKDDWLAVIRKI